MILQQCALKLNQISRKLSYAFVFYNGMNEKKNLSLLSPLNGRKKNKETEPNFESL